MHQTKYFALVATRTGKWAFGIATNATLIGNRFCDVTTPINVEPLVTATTNQGTLVCPFPPPTLPIAPPFILSWPGEAGGWLVESAPGVNGPWNSESVTSAVQAGQTTVAMKTDTEHRIFRLRPD